MKKFYLITLFTIITVSIFAISYNAIYVSNTTTIGHQIYKKINEKTNRDGSMKTIDIQYDLNSINKDTVAIIRTEVETNVKKTKYLYLNKNIIDIEGYEFIVDSDSSRLIRK